MEVHTISSPTPTGSEQEVDRTNAIKIASWTILGITVTIFLARQVMKTIVFRTFALGDLLILLATVFAIGLSITTIVLASEGLGVFGFLTLEQADILFKGYYASEFLYISAICFAKLSLLALFYTIVVVQRWHRRFVLGFGMIVIAWTIGSLLAVAFQCELPQPWEMMTSRCFNSRVFWIVYCVIDMSTEISIIMLSVNLVAYLKVRFSRKVAVVACFAPRALVISAALVRLVWLYPISPYSNPQYRLWLPAIMTQIQVCLSVFTACIPYMVPFFKSLEGNLRRTYSTKSRDFRMANGHEQTHSSLWFRRHGKGKEFNSWDSTALATLQYGRVSQVSPHIPTPTPISPLTPPRLCTPPSRSLGERGLSISIPDGEIRRERTDSTRSPQTASSSALSPTCTSPQPLLSLSFVPTRAVPAPPPRSRSPRPRSHATPPSNISLTQHFSLFPNSRSPQSRQHSFSSPNIPPIRALQSETVSNAITHSPSLYPYNLSENDNEAYRSRSSSNAHAPKFSTAPQPTTRTQKKLQKRPESIQSLNSPMGNAINNYFNNPVPWNPPPPPAPPLSILQEQRNQQILSPSNFSHVPSSLTHNTTDPPAPHDILRDDLFLPHDSISMARTSRSTPQLPVKDVRHSPRIVVRSPL